MRWRQGALFFFVLLVATAIFSSCVERLFSSTIPSSAFLASLKPRIWRPLFTGSLRNCETVILLVSLTRLGLPKFASMNLPKTPVPTLAVYMPTASAETVKAVFRSFSLSVRKLLMPFPASSIPSFTL